MKISDVICQQKRSRSNSQFLVFVLLKNADKWLIICVLGYKDVSGCVENRTLNEKLDCVGVKQLGMRKTAKKSKKTNIDLRLNFHVTDWSTVTRSLHGARPCLGRLIICRVYMFYTALLICECFNVYSSRDTLQ